MWKTMVKQMEAKDTVNSGIGTKAIIINSTWQQYL